MAGITDRHFRRLIIALGGVGGGCTDFVRVSTTPWTARALRRRLGPIEPCPIGIQLLASDADHIAATVGAAEAAGAAFLDLNFGCPAPAVCRHHAGAALLDDPPAIAAQVRAAVMAATVPVTVKLRVGGADANRLEVLLDTAADAGAGMIVLHARQRVDPYTAPADWRWLERAVRHLARHHPDLPLVGNGGIRTPDDAARLHARTGCHGVMVGLGILADPFLLARLAGTPAATSARLATFVLDYAAVLYTVGGRGGTLARLKQLLRNLVVAPEILPEDLRRTWLRSHDLDAILRFWREVAGPQPP